MLRKLIGGLGSPCACSLIGDGPWATYAGVPMYIVSPRSAKWSCTSTPLCSAVTYAGVFIAPSGPKVGAVQTTS